MCIQYNLKLPSRPTTIMHSHYTFTSFHEDTLIVLPGGVHIPTTRLCSCPYLSTNKQCRHWVSLRMDALREFSTTWTDWCSYYRTMHVRFVMHPRTNYWLYLMTQPPPSERYMITWFTIAHFVESLSFAFHHLWIFAYFSAPRICTTIQWRCSAFHATQASHVGKEPPSSIKPYCHFNMIPFVLHSDTNG